MSIEFTIHKSVKVFLFGFIIFLESCITGGTHGSIKAYEYSTSKATLQKAVENVIATNKLIQRDTTKNYMIDITDGRQDTIFVNHYNDGETYVTIYLKEDEGLNEYILQYSGDQKYWDTSKKAKLSIAYAFDGKGHGGSEENNNIKWYNLGLKKRLLSTFENEFIIKVDKKLNLNHVDVK